MKIYRYSKIETLRKIITNLYQQFTSYKNSAQCVILLCHLLKVVLPVTSNSEISTESSLGESESHLISLLCFEIPNPKNISFIFSYEFSNLLKTFGWITSVTLGTVTTFSVSLFYQEWYQYSSIEAAAYISLHKFAWSIANGWLVIACATGNGGKKLIHLYLYCKKNKNIFSFYFFLEVLLVYS